jgi:hypothetical protein
VKKFLDAEGRDERPKTGMKDEFRAGGISQATVWRAASTTSWGGFPKLCAGGDGRIRHGEIAGT